MGNMTMTKIIAHRGASGYAPENTLEAFEKAIVLGADMIEFDVIQTKDKELIVMHGDKINGQKIADLNFSEIKAINPAIPKLTKVLETFKNRIEMDIELQERGYEEELCGIILKYLNPSQFIITSFLADSLRIIKEKFPQIKTGYLIGYKKMLGPKTLLKSLFPFGKLRKIKADFLVAHRRLLYLNILQRAKIHKTPIIVWGVNKKKLIYKLLKKNIFGVITDYVDLVKK
jgi:glycerophosphoryl diester phosphodiesterase